MTTHSFDSWFKLQFPTIPLPGAMAILKLAGEGATVPFIARYRKEATGNLDEVAVQKTIEAKKSWDEIESRKEYILQEINAQGKMTDALQAQIATCYNLTELEDLYLPYKKKRKTKATIAKEAGLEPLATWIWDRCNGGLPSATESLQAYSATFVNPSLGVADGPAAIEGAQHILTERISEMAELRQQVRTILLERGYLVSSKAEKAKPHSKFEPYFDYQCSVQSLLDSQSSHRYLAMRRGEAEEELQLRLGGSKDEPTFEETLLNLYQDAVCKQRTVDAAPPLLQSARLALRVYVLPSIAAEIHLRLKTIADEAAIQVFSENLRALLLAAPFGAKTVLGVDPGVRTGCKLALIDKSGRFIATSVIHPENASDVARMKGSLTDLAKTTGMQAIAIGNGTASRETESFFRKLLTELHLSIPVIVVSEAGASVYSASEVAREEFPNLDLTVRGAISIARRLQDPLAELVKLDPKSIGVGQYQHDVSQPALKASLERVVESCVNAVGVNLNTASKHLLAYVSGIGPSLAQAITEHREKNGLFKSRKDLLNVPRFGEKAFEQAAGFLRLPDGEEALDATGVHPERYDAIKSFAQTLGKGVKDLLGKGASLLKSDGRFKEQVGNFTFEDIIRELEKPGRDPRETFVAFEFLKDVHEVKDLKPGMLCPGIVTNVTNFGAFVDIGVHQDGLVHISQMSDSFVKDPRSIVSPGDKVKVHVLEVNLEKNQIALSMKTNPEIARSSQKSGTNTANRSNEPRRNRDASRHAAANLSFDNNPFASLGSGKR